MIGHAALLWEELDHWLYHALVPLPEKHPCNWSRAPQSAWLAGVCADGGVC